MGDLSKAFTDDGLKVFVPGLKTITADELEKYFTEFLGIRSVKKTAIKENVTGEFNTFGTVFFNDKKLVKTVLENEIHKINNVEFRVQRYNSDGQMLEISNQRLKTLWSKNTLTISVKLPHIHAEITKITYHGNSSVSLLSKRKVSSINVLIRHLT